ncbi:MAG: Uma2 family endonuclease [Candidatus Xenobia bacterium]
MQPFHEAMSMRRMMSLDEFLAMPEDPMLEWVRGEVVTRAMPTNLHGLVAAVLSMHLTAWALEMRTGAPMIEVRITYRQGDDPRSIIPDLSFMSRDRFQGPARHEHLAEAPDLAIEVLSPGQSFASMIDRVNWLLTHGSRLVWIMDGEDRRISVFRHGAPPQVLSQGDVLQDADVLPGFELTMRQLFDEVDQLAGGEKPA